MKFTQSKSWEEGTFDCGLCGQAIAIDVRAIGTEVSCPHCDGEIIVPGFVKSDDTGSGSKNKPIADHSASERSGDRPAVSSMSLPPPRKQGESPTVAALAEENQELPSYSFTGAASSSVEGAAIVPAICRGDVGIFKSRRIGNRHVAFGCPFCAKPIEIKLRQQGKQLQCVECSGTMIAPDLDTGEEVQTISGKGGIAGSQKVNLPGVKTPSLQKAESLRDPLSRPLVKSETRHENSPDGIAPVTVATGESSVRNRLNNDREAKRWEEGTFDCGLCGQAIAIDVRAVGAEVSCPHCDGEIIVPGFVKSDDTGSGSKNKPIADHSASERSGDRPAVSSMSLPPPRKQGESPTVAALAEENQELPSYSFTGAASSSVEGAAIVPAICRGDVGIFKSRRIGNRHVAFGCPFCAKPIEIKLRQQGKQLQCVECSGTMIAPDLDTGEEVQTISGKGGIAGSQKVNLPGVKTPSLQKAESLRDPLSRPLVKSETRHENSPDGIAPVTVATGEGSVRHRLNNDREAKLISPDIVEVGQGMENQWDTLDGRGEGSGNWMSRLRFIALIMMPVSMVLIVVMSLKRSNRMEEAAVSEGSSPGKGFDEKTPAQRAISLSSEFSLLSTVNQRLKYVRHPNASLSRMKKYYAAVPNNIVFPPLDVRSYQDEVIDGIRFARMTSIVEPGKRQREFFFELSEGGGLLLDWESATGYCDTDVMEYSSGTTTGPVQMRVMVKPSDYYAFEFADADAFDCYEITDLISRIRIYGYVESVSANGEALRGLHPGERQEQKGFVYCTLVLRASKGADSRGARQVRIDKMVKNNWLLP